MEEDKKYIIEEVETIAYNLRKKYELTYFESLQIANQIQQNITLNSIYLIADIIQHDGLPQNDL